MATSGSEDWGRKTEELPFFEINGGICQRDCGQRRIYFLKGRALRGRGRGEGAAAQNPTTTERELREEGGNRGVGGLSEDYTSSVRKWSVTEMRGGSSLGLILN